jgi:hypothetical protein
MFLFLISSARAQNLAITESRPLRYHPDGTDFTIENGEHWFNRPLYGPHTPFHIDGGDKPEFVLINTTLKAGVLRLGLASPAGDKWLADCKQVDFRYRPGSLIYDIHDPILGDASLHLTVLSSPTSEGLLLRAEYLGGTSPAKLVFVYGGLSSLARPRTPVAAGDVITNANVSAIRAIDENNGRDLGPQLALAPDQCAGDTITTDAAGFVIHNGPETVTGKFMAGATVAVADGAKMENLHDLLASKASSSPLAVGQATLDQPFYLTVTRANPKGPQASDASSDLPALFAASEAYRESIANMITIDTPDPYINTVPGALAVAADGYWQSPVWEHGAVSWRTTLLGWRGPYAGDAIGWHDRADAYLTYWAGRQNTKDDFPTVAVPNPARGLAENDGAMLHSNGSIPQTHYDMNMVYMDILLRHLLWTGDLGQARKLWPVIQRHLAWEKRLFDRDGLYEAYAAIWASDALQYNGGGSQHGSAYNEFANRMAARVAALIGENPAPYEAEANRIHAAIESKLWMPKLGWYAEYLDVMGEKQLHTSAAIWSIYHTVDSRVSDPFETWQALRYVDTSIAHIPVRGPGVPDGNFYVIPESNWMPYEWSLNNVVTGENTHTALAYWEGGRNETAFNLFKSTMLDTMYLGMTPGNLPNLSAYDPYRGESYTDFGDPTGITSRSLVEGLFGIRPDALAGELTIHSGFPSSWDHASINTHDLSYKFKLTGQTETWSVDLKFPKPMKLRLQLPARGISVASVQINGQPAQWINNDNAVGSPWIEIAAVQPAAHYDVTVQWEGGGLPPATVPVVVAKGATVKFDFEPARLLQVSDPQKALSDIKSAQSSVTATASGEAGYRTAFAKVNLGRLTWWTPIEFEIPQTQIAKSPALQVDPGAKYEPVDMTSSFNDKVTQIFLNDYLTPRPQTVSLQMPIHGYSDWTGPQKTFTVNDSGLRRAAGSAGIYKLPTGILFKTPGEANAKNIAFTSQFDNYPRRLSVPLSGKSSHAYFLMAGSTNAMESQIDNGELVVTYADGSTDALPLHNPTNWWPIDKDYRIDDYAFRRPGPRPMRVALETGNAYVPGAGGGPRGGAATVLDMPLDGSKDLKSVTVHTESYEIVIGLMSVTLQRP